MTAESCFQAIKQLAESTGYLLALRQGGSSDLGLVGAKETDVPSPVRPKSFCARGIPRSWGQDDVQMFLGTEGWTALEITSQRKGFYPKKDYPEWFFKGKPPDQSKQGFWHFQDESCHITIAPNSTAGMSQ